MLARTIPLLLALFAIPAIASAVEPEAETVQQDVVRMNRALYSGDAKTLIRYTNPKLIEMLGGHAQAEQALKQGAMQLVGRMSVESLDFPTPPTFFESAESRFVFVPTLSVVSVQGQRVESLNFQLGARSKTGEQWTYVEGSRITHENVRTFFPDFPEGVEFPKFHRKRL